MGLAYRKQKFQDWFTQQWAIFWGKRIEPKTVPWLMGPLGEPGAKADDFIHKLANENGLVVKRNHASHGLIPAIEELKLSGEESARLSPIVKEFYEKTGLFRLEFSVKWNPFFVVFGKLVNLLFSNRIGQLNVPTANVKDSEEISSEIITLSDPDSGEVKYTVWYRTFKSTGQAGVYTTCTLPSGKTCVKAIFPLPNGNATVIMTASVGSKGELLLDSSGEKFGDPGFYFLLKDSKGGFWSQYISSFRDRLIVSSPAKKIRAEQTLTLWRWRVLRFYYEIHRDKTTYCNLHNPKR